MGNVLLILDTANVCLQAMTEWRHGGREADGGYTGAFIGGRCMELIGGMMIEGPTGVVRG